MKLKNIQWNNHMNKEEHIKTRSIIKYWTNYGRKIIFTWVYRYLRLHNELLTDNVYQEIYDYHRNTLIAYHKKRTTLKEFDEQEYCNVFDSITDMYNKTNAKQVNKYKWLVDELYKFWKESPNDTSDIQS